MTHNSDNEIRVELKYCERCGGLWFRGANSKENLCRPCAAGAAETAFRYLGKTGSSQRKPIARPEVQGSWYGPMSGVIDRLQGVAIVTVGAA